MTKGAAILCLGLIFSTSPRIGGTDTPPFIHVRSTETAIAAAVEAGTWRSPLFRNLVSRLNASNVVVHVVFDQKPIPNVAGHLVLAASVGGVRYLRVFVVRGLSGCDFVAIIGHELQHAVEIAETPWVIDRRTMAIFYASAGSRTDWLGPDTYETAAAAAAGRQIRREFLAPRTTAGLR